MTISRTEPFPLLRLVGVAAAVPAAGVPAAGVPVLMVSPFARESPFVRASPFVRLSPVLRAVRPPVARVVLRRAVVWLRLFPLLALSLPRLLVVLLAPLHDGGLLAEDRFSPLLVDARPAQFFADDWLADALPDDVRPLVVERPRVEAEEPLAARPEDDFPDRRSLDALAPFAPSR